MRMEIAAVTLLLLLAGVQAAHAEVPDWIRTTAALWSSDQIDDQTFVDAIAFLIAEGIISVDAETADDAAGGGVPEWVKSNALLWSEGAIDDATFLAGIEYLVNVGIIYVPGAVDEVLEQLEGELQACYEIKRAYDRINCISEVELKILVHQYKTDATAYDIGPATFYYMGQGSDGNSLEMRDGAKASLSIRMLVVNNDESNLTMSCSGPAVCNYDVWDGTTAFKYSATDFTSGLITLKPGDASEFNMLFGPNIGYGGTEFLYDPDLSYSLRVSEPWGSARIPLDLN